MSGQTPLQDDFLLLARFLCVVSAPIGAEDAGDVGAVMRSEGSLRLLLRSSFAGDPRWIKRLDQGSNPAAGSSLHLSGDQASG